MSEQHLIQDTTLTNLADKIRVLSGVEDTMTPAEMGVELDGANNEVGVQSDLIAQIQTALEGKAGGSSDVGGDVIYFTVQNNMPDDLWVAGAHCPRRTSTDIPDFGVSEIIQFFIPQMSEPYEVHASHIEVFQGDDGMVEESMSSGAIYSRAENTGFTTGVLMGFHPRLTQTKDNTITFKAQYE